MTFTKQILAALLALILVPAGPARCANTYLDMSLEDLMDLTVTSVSKRAQPVQEAAAAVHVLTGEDIRRSGATSIPEALRMVPGLMVGQNAASAWSISSRGRSFNPAFDNKLLVMIDGRSVYSPVFSGVFWDSLDLVMEDIDRIEIIRGPGSSAWGANAVNGIINIITRASSETQGLMASGILGAETPGTAAVRYGGKFGEGNSYRVYGKYRNLAELETFDGDELHDGVESGVAGFRTDLTPDPASTLTVQGDMYQGISLNTLAYPDLATVQMVEDDTSSDVHIASILTRYTRDVGNSHVVTLQSYYNHDDRGSDAWQVGVDTLDLDFQHQFSPWADHVAQWGLSYRLTSEWNEKRSPAVSFAEANRRDNLYSAFLQDEITLGDWVLTLGSKFEHNDQTGLEILPSARLLWHATPKHAFWGAASRSVRTPSIAEQDATYNTSIVPNPNPFPPAIQISMTGNSDMESETALVYELGYRFTPTPKFMVDAALFLTQADNLPSVTLDATQGYFSATPLPHWQIDSDTANNVSGTIHGAELAATWVPLNWWKIQGWYAHCEDSYEHNGDGENVFDAMYGRISPRHQFFARSSMDLPHDTELDIMGRYVSELPGLNIPDYGTVDIRLGWRPQRNVEIALVGKNLIESRHLEAASDIVYGSTGTVGRCAFLKLRVDF